MSGIRSFTPATWGRVSRFACVPPRQWPSSWPQPRTCRSSIVRSTRQASLHAVANCGEGQSEHTTKGSTWTINRAGVRQHFLHQKRKQWQREDVHLVLVHPQIPQNTGTIARTCAATSVALHLVKPLGYSIDSTKLKRAGLDYWDHVCVEVHDSWQEFHAFFQRQQGPKRLIGFTKFAEDHYAAPGLYRSGDWLLFGAETTGMPQEAHEACRQEGRLVKIPMIETHVRSLNLAVSAGVGLYEAIRQLDTAGGRMSAKLPNGETIA